MVVDAQRWDRQYAEHDPPTFEDVPAVDFSPQALPGGAFELVLIAYLQVATAVLAAVLSRAAGAVAPGGRLVAVEAVVRAVRPAVTP